LQSSKNARRIKNAEYKLFGFKNQGKFLLFSLIAKIGLLAAFLDESNFEKIQNISSKKNPLLVTGRGFLLFEKPQEDGL